MSFLAKTVRNIRRILLIVLNQQDLQATNSLPGIGQPAERKKTWLVKLQNPNETEMSLQPTIHRESRLRQNIVKKY